MVVEAERLDRGTRALHVTQPALGRTIAGLGKCIGALSFERHAKGM